jgi:hypothetical protein
MRIPFCPWEAGDAPSQFANWFAGALRQVSTQAPARQLEANDGEVQKRKRDKTWNDVAAAQKRGVESQVCRSDPTQARERQEAFRGLTRAELGSHRHGMKEYPVASNLIRISLNPRLCSFIHSFGTNLHVKNQRGRGGLLVHRTGLLELLFKLQRHRGTAKAMRALSTSQMG